MMNASTRPALRGQEVFNWLHRLDLTHHFDKFLGAGYDELHYCRRLGEGDLQALGITDIHEKLALLQAIRLLHVTATPTATPHNQRGGEEIELQLLKNNKSRVLFYNNNNYPKFEENEGEADYSECAEFDLTRCSYCEGGGGGLCAQCSSSVSDPEPFYESVLDGGSGGGVGGGRMQMSSRENILNQGMLLRNLKTQLRDQVIHDGINFSRVSQYFITGTKGFGNYTHSSPERNSQNDDYRPVDHAIL